jgi:hypothetical protein
LVTKISRFIDDIGKENMSLNTTKCVDTKDTANYVWQAEK